MGREIERKYLIRNDRWRSCTGPGTRYLQGYLSLDPERNVRVRVANADATLTIKGKSEGPIREEFEYRIPLEDADCMLAKICIKPVIEKIRYVIQDGELKWAIDEFKGENRGLIVVELETKDSSEAIVKPDWVGQEVTDDSRYFNFNLVKRPYSEWARSPSE